VKKLKFHDKPDYAYLIGLFKECLIKNNYEYEPTGKPFSWNHEAGSAEKINEIKRIYH